MMTCKRLAALRCWFGVAALGCTMLALVGCGSSGVLYGKVTFKGTPMPSGTSLTFLNQKTDRSYPAQVEANGEYRIEKLPAGTYKIGVQPPGNPNIGGNTPGGNITTAVGKKGGEGIMAPSGGNDVMSPPGGLGGVFKLDPNAKNFPVPVLERDAKTSTMSVEVKGGKQEHNIPVPEM